jgi:8-oxo-dGTP pyrophosphatase MutT (NUDIX family)
MLKNSERAVSLLLPYKKENGEILVYLQRRDKDAKRLPDWFGFFGGGIEEGESPEQALLREVKEELNYLPIKTQFLGEYANRWVYILYAPADFESSVTVLEGQYGKWFHEKEVLNEPLLTESDKEILKSFYQSLQFEGKRDTKIV